MKDLYNKHLRHWTDNSKRILKDGEKNFHVHKLAESIL